MEEGKLDILDLSKPKNSSLPISLDKMKKSKVFKNKMTKKFQQSFKKFMPKEKEKDKGEKKIKNKFLSMHIINKQLQKHNSNPSKKNVMIINDIIETKTNHFLAIFKDYLITDYIDEFLKRYFTVNESTELLPKFYIYYQNYLKFFCRGLFTDFKANKIIQEYGECQAELYYNKNYGGKEKKSKKNKDENNDNIIDDGDGDAENNSNVSKTRSNVNKLRLLFTDTVKNSINRIENSKLLQNYIYKYNTNEISNIFYKSKNETMTLNDDTKIYYDDDLMTNENSLINLIDVMIHKKREKKKIIKNKNIKNNYINDKNIVNIYKNLLDQSPIKSARNLNYNIKNGLYNKTSKKVASIKIFNRNIPMIIKNKKQNNNISNDIKEKNIKTPISEKPNKIISKNNFHSRNSKFNNSGNFFMKSNLTQKIYRNTSKSISSRIGLGNIMTSKNNNKNKFSSFNTNLNQNSKKKLKFNGIYFKNTNENFLSTSSSRNLKKNFICSYQTNKNNQKLNNRIRHYQYITLKNKNQLKQKNSKHKQSCSLSNSNSIFNNFHININNNIMLLNNNTHYNSNKNNLKANSKIKKKIDDIKLTLNKQNKSRNNGIDLKKYKTEIKYLQNNNIKSKKNICSSIRKYIYLVKTKSKDKNNKNREQLIRNKSNIFSSNHSCFKIKKTGEDSDVMPSLKNIKKLNNSNKNLNLNKVPKINIIFDYKRK